MTVPRAARPRRPVPISSRRPPSGTSFDTETLDSFGETVDTRPRMVDARCYRADARDGDGPQLLRPVLERRAARLPAAAGARRSPAGGPGARAGVARRRMRRRPDLRTGDRSRGEPLRRRGRLRRSEEHTPE